MTAILALVGAVMVLLGLPVAALAALTGMSGTVLASGSMLVLGALVLETAHAVDPAGINQPPP